MQAYVGKLDVDDDGVDDVDDEVAAMPALYFDELVRRGFSEYTIGGRGKGGEGGGRADGRGVWVILRGWSWSIV
jgi:hypothetical protein